jgi:hypothetical protein
MAGINTVAASPFQAKIARLKALSLENFGQDAELPFPKANAD